MTQVPIVLASASPRRKALLEALGIEIDVVVSEVSETLEGVPGEVVIQNAIAKRDDVRSRTTIPGLIVAADTVVVIDGELLGKPEDLDAARAMLAQLSGNTHSVLTGIAIAHTGIGRTAEDVEETRVTFRDLSEEEIELFVEAVRPLDRAGAYTVDGPGSLLVARYEGCYQNVLGLPLVCLDRLLRSIGDSLYSRIRADQAQFL